MARGLRRRPGGPGRAHVGVWGGCLGTGNTGRKRLSAWRPGKLNREIYFRFTGGGKAVSGGALGATHLDGFARRLSGGIVCNSDVARGNPARASWSFPKLEFRYLTPKHRYQDAARRRLVLSQHAVFSSCGPSVGERHGGRSRRGRIHDAARERHTPMVGDPDWSSGCPDPRRSKGHGGGDGEEREGALAGWVRWMHTEPPPRDSLAKIRKCPGPGALLAPQRPTQHSP